MVGVSLNSTRRRARVARGNWWKSFVIRPADDLPVGLTRECECESTTNIGVAGVAIPKFSSCARLALVHLLYGL
jgi:hypothetical protein